MICVKNQFLKKHSSIASYLWPSLVCLFRMLKWISKIYHWFKMTFCAMIPSKQPWIELFGVQFKHSNTYLLLSPLCLFLVMKKCIYIYQIQYTYYACIYIFHHSYNMLSVVGWYPGNKNGLDKRDNKDIRLHCCRI